MTYRFTTSHFPSLVGFDRLFDELDRMVDIGKQPSYPPYNVKKTDDTHYQIDFAVAGFSKEDIDLEVKDSVLTVSAKRKETENDGAFYLHRGLANRAFNTSFTLAENVEVEGASIENGILKIALKHNIPEEKRVKKIEIGESLKTISTPQLLTEE